MAASLGVMVKQLRAQEQILSNELGQLRQAIAALTGMSRPVRGQSRGAAPVTRRRKRRLSAEARARISAAQKRRWAKHRAKRSEKA
jgi:hypothetical protein